MKRRNRRGNLFTMLLSNYILFTLLVIGAFILALWLAFLGSGTDIAEEQISKYDDLLSSGRYEEFPAARLLGEMGFVAVLDDTGQVVYNPADEHIELSADEVRYIPEFSVPHNTSTYEIRTDDGAVNYELSFFGPSGLEVIILDQDFKPLYDSGSRTDFQMSERKYLLLSDRFFDGYSVSRYPFQSAQGAPYTLLLFEGEEVGFDGLLDFFERLSTGFLLFGFFYILLIVLLILWLKRRINRPLRLLCDTFQNYQIGTPLAQSYRGPREFVAIFDNFSAMARRLEDSEQHRKDLEENRRKMLADIAHDLKTPVSVIQGYTRAMCDDLIAPEEQPKYWATLQQKASALNELINTFYEYSKLEHPDFSLNLERGDICNYFRDFVAERYTELETAGFLVEVDIPEQHIPCMLDRGQLKRAFANIVGNAMKYTPPGSTLYFGLEQTAGAVILSLADNGTGIPGSLAQNIFTPFVMGDAARGSGGSGLGLAIAKRIVEAHGGTIHLVSGQDFRWATLFEISLPTCKTYMASLNNNNE